MWIVHRINEKRIYDEYRILHWLLLNVKEAAVDSYRVTGTEQVKATS